MVSSAQSLHSLLWFLPERLQRLVVQLFRFVLVGAINTGIDFAVFNGLMLITGIQSGAPVVVINTIAFCVAVINSYFLNKYWTFEERHSAAAPKEAVKFSTFLIVSILGAGINGSVVYALTTFVTAPLYLSATLFANVAKLIATVFSMMWNFIGYKLFVFRRR